MDIKRLTDDRELLIKELEKEILNTVPEDDIKPSKYNEGTGTFYVDEELARQKLGRNVPLFEKKEEKPDFSLEEMIANMVKEESAPEQVKKVGIYRGSEDNSWHSNIKK